jgi:uncharacterized protein (UPF0335 family)
MWFDTTPGANIAVIPPRSPDRPRPGRDVDGDHRTADQDAPMTDQLDRVRGRLSSLVRTEFKGTENTMNNNQIKTIIERIERLEADKAGIADDIKDIYAEAKGNGYDVKALRAVIRRRKQDAVKLAQHEEMVEIYLAALGQLSGTPLGEAAIKRVVG